jgi:putative RecB family exonuclease
VLASKGKAMLQAFHEQAPRPQRVLGVEEPFSVRFDLPARQPSEVRMVGVFDAVIQNADGSYAILEHKTASRRYTETRLAHDIQVTAYHLVAPLVGLADAEVTLQVLLKTKEPTLVLHTPPRTKNNYCDFKDILSGVIAAIDANAYYPVRDWWCQSCVFRSRCQQSP